ncbi:MULTISPECIES: efflux RND transporter permease subunit [Legionella]|uniref:efflux RND transporter permease subunit n=1 Tax=Legionella sp. 39-23 TaxID=1895902 RepID=UPI002FDA9839
MRQSASSGALGLGGTGSEVMRRIAAPMVGGMLSATVLTLIVIPVIYLLWQQRKYNV